MRAVWFGLVFLSASRDALIFFAQSDFSLHRLDRLTAALAEGTFCETGCLSNMGDRVERNRNDRKRDVII